MVSKEEIEHVAKLMRIELDDHLVHIDRVQKMIDYFDLLDNAGVEEEEILAQEIPISSLRQDEHIPFFEKLIDNLKNYKGTFVKAPKMK